MATDRRQLKHAYDLVNAKRYDSALSHINFCLAEDPDNAVLWTYKGKALGFLRRTSEALDAYRRGVELCPEDPDKIANLAWGLSFHGTASEAADVFDKLTRNPKARKLSGYWHFGYAKVLSDLGDTDGAMRELLAAARKNSYFSTRALKEARQLNVTHPFVETIELYHFILTKEWEKGLERLDGIIAANSANAPAWSMLGLVHDKLFHPEVALNAYRKGVELEPDNPERLLFLARGLYRQATPPEAMAAFTELADHPCVDTLNSEWLMDFGLAAHAVNNDEEALSCYLHSAREVSFPCDAGYYTWRLQYAAQVDCTHPATGEILAMAMEAGASPDAIVSAMLSMPSVFMSQEHKEKSCANLEAALQWVEKQGLTLQNPLDLAHVFMLGGLVYTLDVTPLRFALAKVLTGLFPKNDSDDTGLSIPFSARNGRLRLGVAIMRSSAADKVSALHMAAFLAKFDRTRFEITLFYPNKHNGIVSPGIIDELRAAVDEVVEYPTGSWQAFQKTFAEANLDILLHENWGAALFCGFTRFAPVQCNFYDHLITTGSTYDDYAIVNFKQENLSELFPLYREKLVALSNTPTVIEFHQNDAEIVTHADLGVPDSVKVLFSWFTITRWQCDDDQIIKTLLQNNPEMWLVVVNTDDAGAVDVLRRWRMVMPEIMERIRVIPYQPMSRLRGILNMIDGVIGPPLTYGTPSIITVLRQGVPMPLLKGGNFGYGSGVGMAMYKKIGLESLFADTPGELIYLTERIIYNIEWRQQLQRQIFSAMNTLNDNASMVDELQDFLEAAYAGARNRVQPVHWLRGRPWHKEGTVALADVGVRKGQV